jgi:hypothetical protein
LTGFNPTYLAPAASQAQHFCPGEVTRTHFPGTSQKVVGGTGTIAVAGIGFIRCKFHVLEAPVRLQLLQVFLGDQLDIDAEFLLHCDVGPQTIAFTRRNDANKADFAEVAGFAHDVFPVVENAQAEYGELDFGRVAVMHADQSR